MSDEQEYPQVAAALAVLDRYLAGKLDRNAAALELSAPVAQAFHGYEKEGDDSAESWLWATWGALMRLVRRLPYNDPAQDLLVRLLSTMKEIHLPANPASQAFENCWGVKFWRDLPVLGPTVREDWNVQWPEGFPEQLPCLGDGEKRYTQNEWAFMWASMNAFVARLTSSHVINFSCYGIWAMRDAFEEPLVGSLGLDDYVPACATWVLEAGHLMYELAVKAEPPPGIANAANCGSLWAGNRIWYNLERWAFWKQSFNAVMNRAELQGRTKEMAARTHAMMKEIEQQAGQHQSSGQSFSDSAAVLCGLMTQAKSL